MTTVAPFTVRAGARTPASVLVSTVGSSQRSAPRTIRMVAESLPRPVSAGLALSDFLAGFARPTGRGPSNSKMTVVHLLPFIIFSIVLLNTTRTSSQKRWSFVVRGAMLQYYLNTKYEPEPLA